MCEVWHAHKLFVGFGGQASSHPETCVGDGNRGSVATPEVNATEDRVLQPKPGNL